MEDRGLKISRKKTVYLKFSGDENLEKVNAFIYLGSTLAEDGHLYAEITHKVQSRWNN